MRVTTHAMYLIMLKLIKKINLGEIVSSINNRENMINLSSLRVTLDIICLTLPPSVQSVISESAFTGLRTTSFCSGSPCAPVSSSSDASIESDE